MRNIMTFTDLDNAGAELIGSIRNGDWVAGAPSREITEREGFYFLVFSDEAASYLGASARFFVAKQRSKAGFESVLSHIRSGRSQLGRTLCSNWVTYGVFWIPANKMKPLTTGYGKGQLALAFTRQHSSDAQTYSELNRILNDNFIFTMQKY